MCQKYFEYRISFLAISGFNISDKKSKSYLYLTFIMTRNEEILFSLYIASFEYDLYSDLRGWIFSH